MLNPAGGEQWIVSENCADADEDGIAACTKLVDHFHGQFVADLLSLSARAGDFAVGALGPFEGDVGTSAEDSGEKGGVELFGFRLKKADSHIDSGSAQSFDSFSSYVGIWIGTSNDDFRHSRFDQRGHARRRFFIRMTARL